MNRCLFSNVNLGNCYDRFGSSTATGKLRSFFDERNPATETCTATPVSGVNLQFRIAKRDIDSDSMCRTKIWFVLKTIFDPDNQVISLG